MSGLPGKKKCEPVPVVSLRISTDQEKLKRCPRCEETKSRSEFHKCKSTGDGLYGYCKECNKKKRAGWYTKNGDIFNQKRRTYRADNNEEVTKQGREQYHKHRESRRIKANKFYDKNKDKINLKLREALRNNPERREINSLRNKEWSKNNEDKKKQYSDEYYEKNKEQLKEKARAKTKSLDEEQREIMRATRRRWRVINRDIQNEKQRIKRDTNITIKLSNNIGTCLRRSLQGNKAGRKWESLVGYTVHDLKVHIENLFTDDMTWDDFLKGNIHIDHKIPIAVFRFTSAEDIEFKNAWSLKNLQPLWATDNIRKNDKIIYPELYKELTGRDA